MSDKQKRYTVRYRICILSNMLHKMKEKLSLKRVFSVFGLVTLLVLTQVGPLAAQTITQGYSSDDPIQRATLVSLNVDDPKKVEPATLDNHDRLHGVVVSQNDASFTLSSEDEKVFVATTGRFEMFVSNENGIIQPGDLLTVSRVAGIGMKAGESNIYVVAKAITGFDGETDVLSTTTIDDGGVDKKVAIGGIQADIGVAGNPLFKPSEANLPGFLQRLAENIAQKPVNPTRIYMSLFLMFASTAVAGTLLYSGIRSGIISIGRNPLSKKSITKSLMQVILTSVIILLLGVFGVYLLLRI